MHVKRFLNNLLSSINRIQTSSYSIACKGKAIDVRFVFSELPNDMKMLAFLAGELSNSATFFSTFADVDNKSIAGNSNGTFGRKCSDTHPYMSNTVNMIWIVKQLHARSVKFVRTVNTSHDPYQLVNAIGGLQ